MLPREHKPGVHREQDAGKDEQDGEASKQPLQSGVLRPNEPRLLMRDDNDLVVELLHANRGPRPLVGLELILRDRLPKQDSARTVSSYWSVNPIVREHEVEILHPA